MLASRYKFNGSFCSIYTFELLGHKSDKWCTWDRHNNRCLSRLLFFLSSHISFFFGQTRTLAISAEGQSLFDTDSKASVLHNETADSNQKTHRRRRCHCFFLRWSLWFKPEPKSNHENKNKKKSAGKFVIVVMTVLKTKNDRFRCQYLSCFVITFHHTIASARTRHTHRRPK